MTRRRALALALAASAAAACGQTPVAVSPRDHPIPAEDLRAAPDPPAATPSRPAAPAVSRDPAVIAARATVPALCYHQIREWRGGESDYSRSMTTPPALFAAQMRLLAEEGWNTISMKEYDDHLRLGTTLPGKPVLLTFDDAHGTQLQALPILKRHQHRATFFLMTVVLGKPDWMGSDDVRRVAALGYDIGAHTYDHQNMATLPAKEFDEQLVRSRQTLETLVGASVPWFAYPFGAWRPRTLPFVEKAGYTAAFQLRDHPLDPARPMRTLRRSLAGSLDEVAGFRTQLRAMT